MAYVVTKKKDDTKDQAASGGVAGIMKDIKDKQNFDNSLKKAVGQQPATPYELDTFKKTPVKSGPSILDKAKDAVKGAVSGAAAGISATVKEVDKKIKKADPNVRD